jgi:GAF domain-containing protein
LLSHRRRSLSHRQGSDKKTGFTTTSILCEVIQTPGGSVVGVMQAINRKKSDASPHPPSGRGGGGGGSGAARAVPFSREDEQLLQNITAQASIALHNMMLYDQARMARARAQALLDLVDTVSIERDFRTLTNCVCEIVADALGASHALVLMFNHERKELWTPPQGDRPGWSISFPHHRTDAPSLQDTLEARRKADGHEAAAAAQAGAGAGAGANSSSSARSGSDDATLDLSWLAWQVVRTGEQLNLKAEGDIHVALDVLNHTKSLQPANSPRGTGAGGASVDGGDAPSDGAQRASTLLVFPCAHRDRVTAVIIAAGKQRSSSGRGTSAKSGFEQLGAKASTKPAYFDANDEELMAAICSKVSAAFELRSMEMAMSKVALDMASDDAGAGRLGAYDIGNVHPGELKTRKLKERRNTEFAMRRESLLLTLAKASQGLDMQRLQSWDLDLLTMEESELHVIALTCINAFELPDTLGFKPATFLRLCHRVQSGYRPNPYHNYRHAISVMQVAFIVLTTTEAGARLPRTAVLAILLGSLVHDLDHPGTNNAFQVNSGSPLAILYNDSSVLENHHAAKAFQLLRDEPDLDILRGLAAKVRAVPRAGAHAPPPQPFPRLRAGGARRCELARATTLPHGARGRAPLASVRSTLRRAAACCISRAPLGLPPSGAWSHARAGSSDGQVSDAELHSEH